MKISTYFKLFRYLTNEQGLSSKHAILNIRRIVHMSPKVLQAFEQWFIGKQIPEIVVNDVSFIELTEKEGMAPVRAFLMLDWINKDPQGALHYLSEERFEAPLSPLSAEELKETKASVDRLRQKGAVSDVPQTMTEDFSEVTEDEIAKIVEEESNR